jgi:hypothetical protein
MFKQIIQKKNMLTLTLDPWQAKEKIRIKHTSSILGNFDHHLLA